jgi:hypothetical protein
VGAYTLYISMSAQRNPTVSEECTEETPLGALADGIGDPAGGGNGRHRGPECFEGHCCIKPRGALAMR